MSYEKYKENIIATNKARREAIKLLIINHQEEFDALYKMTALRYDLNTTKVNSRIARRTEEKLEMSLEQNQ